MKDQNYTKEIEWFERLSQKKRDKLWKEFFSQKENIPLVEFIRRKLEKEKKIYKQKRSNNKQRGKLMIKIEMVPSAEDTREKIVDFLMKLKKDNKIKRFKIDILGGTNGK